MQDRPTDVNVTEYEKFTDEVLGSKLQLIFKLLVTYGCSIKEYYASLPEKATKILLYFPTTYLWEARFSSYASTKTTYHKRMYAEGDSRTNSLKLGIRRITKT